MKRWVVLKPLLGSTSTALKSPSDTVCEAHAMVTTVVLLVSYESITTALSNFHRGDNEGGDKREKSILFNTK
jgi:hypothetical protein